MENKVIRTIDVKAVAVEPDQQAKLVVGPAWLPPEYNATISSMLNHYELDDINDLVLRACENAKNHLSSFTEQDFFWADFFSNEIEPSIPPRGHMFLGVVAIPPEKKSLYLALLAVLQAANVSDVIAALCQQYEARKVS